MGQINMGRLVIGGIVAAVVLFVIGFIVQGVILGGEWAAWQQAGHMPYALSHAGMMVIWIIVSLVNGLTGLWIYAGIRPRFGAGPKTALLAGFMLWLAGGLAHALGGFALGNLPQGIIIIGGIGALIADLLAILAGAYFYKEP
jgi:hypothetical protein